MTETLFRIDDSAQLCGFKHLPFALFWGKKGKTYFYDREQYELLLHCDGETPIDIEQLSEAQRETLDRLIEDELVTRIDESKALGPFQRYRKFNNIFKQDAHWSITGRCNYRCKHCFMSCPGYTEADPSFEQCVNLIEQMAQCGIRSASITGGEPLIRPDFLDIVREMRDHGIMPSSILTNGALVTEELLDGLDDLKLHPSFQMSYDGVGWHDWLRGIDGAEAQVERAFKLLHERGFSTSSAMVLHKHNRGSIRQSVNKLAEWGCSSLKINVASPEGLWVDQPEHFLSCEDGYQTYLDYLPLYYEDGCPINLMLEDAFVYDRIEGRGFVLADREGPKDVPCYVCGPLRSGFYLGPEGQVFPCQSFIAKDISARYPSAFDMPLQQILTDSTYTQDTLCKFADFLAANQECRECEWGEVCRGGCRAQAISTHDMNYNAKNDAMCVFFKNGWYDRFTSFMHEKNGDDFPSSR